MPVRWTLVLSGVCIILAGCATTGIYYENLNSLVRDGRYREAVSLVDGDPGAKDFYTSKNELLYWLDKGFLSHLSGEYGESNLAFEKAKKISEELFTKSITAEASTFLISDNMRPYAGEDFERVLINIFSALNYVLLNDYENALVELRQVDNLLKTFETVYDGKTSYREDAFARYLAGLIYEAAGEINDAHISYLRALEAYKNYYEKNYGVSVPRELVADAVRTAAQLGFYQRVEELKKEYHYYEASPARRSEKEEKGGKASYDGPEIIVIIYAGLSPVKIDNFFEISFGRAWLYVGSVQTRDDNETGDVERARRIARSIAAEEQVVMAFPKYVPSEYRARSFTVKVSAPRQKDENRITETEGDIMRVVEPSLSEDIGAIATKSLEERIGRIRIKTIARAAVKYALSKKISSDVARSSGDKTLAWLTQKILTLASTATELADKRSWRTLPDKIFIARTGALPADGKYDLIVDFKNDYGEVIASKVIKDVSPPISGRKRFIVLRSAV